MKEAELEQALKLFEEENYEKSIQIFIDLYSNHYFQEEIIDFIYLNFIEPNQVEFQNSFNQCPCSGKPDYKDLVLDFIPVKENVYYIYDKREKDFCGKLDLCNASQGETSVSDKKFVFINIMNFSQIYELYQQNPANHWGALLNKNQEIFYSFCKVPELHDLFEKVNIFSTYLEMFEYYITNTEEELPVVFCGDNLEKCKRICEMLCHVRYTSLNLYGQEGESRLSFEDAFFEEEVREGFTVTSLMKRAWAAEMEMLQIIIDICKENNLKYSAEGGTLLGAVRHKGFIPWDDDIDLMMLRDDYEKLVHIVQTQLGDKYKIYGFFENGYEKTTNNKCCCSFETVVSNWDYMTYIHKFHGYPFGVAVDIFVLDNVSKDTEFFDIQGVVVTNIFRFLYYKQLLRERNEYEKQLALLEKLLNVKLQEDETLDKRLFNYMIQILKMCQEEEVTEVEFGNRFSDERRRFSLDWFQELIEVPFENMKISIPKNYHDVLCIEFDEDYMQPKKMIGAHEYPCYKIAQEGIEEQLIDYGFGQEIEAFYRHPDIYAYKLMIREMEEM